MSFASKEDCLRTPFPSYLSERPGTIYLIAKGYSFLGIGQRQHSLQACYEQNNVPSPEAGTTWVLINGHYHKERWSL